MKGPVENAVPKLPYELHKSKGENVDINPINKAKQEETAARL